MSNAKRLREEAILQAQFAANVKQAHDQLERLILAAQQQLADAEAIPNAYATLADDLTQELSATRYFLESAPADDSAVSELRTRLTLGDQLQQQLAQRWQLWQQFVHERDSANSRLDAVHSKLNKLMTKSREPLVDVRNSVDQLKV